MYEELIDEIVFPRLCCNEFPYILLWCELRGIKRTVLPVSKTSKSLSQRPVA